VYCDVNDFKLFYFRNSNGLEVDAIIEKNDGTWSAFEIKTGSELGIKSGIKNLLSFFDSLSENKQGKMKNLNIIVSNGTTYTDKTTGINIITLNDLFSDN
jgi:predicted AAA+ superfamily ATPase